MTHQLRIVLAQTNFLLGNVAHNADLIIEKARIARDQCKADIIVFPELMLVGYPAEDLLYRTDLYVGIEAAIKKICSAIQGIDVVFGLPILNNQKRYNGAVVIRDGKIIAEYHKQELPNYGVFDEKRYFTPGEQKYCVFTSKNGIKIALVICEDIWNPSPAEQIKQTDAQLVLVINASPFDINKQARRERTLQERARFLNLPILYVNYSGGQDDLVFDGNSMAVDAQGKLVAQAAEFEETLMQVEFVEKEQQLVIKDFSLTLEMTDYNHQTTNHKLEMTKTNLSSRSATRDPIATIYKALTLAIHDYIEKNHFNGIILGLSGGIDSALTLALAVDALGKDRVKAVMMPARYTTKLSKELANQQATAMGVEYQVVDIEPLFQVFLDSLQPELGKLSADITEQNIQARIRAVVLMSIANKKQFILLSTSNKSEIAVGYSTIYGDMCGGFCALKDIYKTVVYELAKYRNNINPVIPEAVITRAPTAELAPNQKDQDSLPAYEILDEILKRYIELDYSAEKIVAEGFDKAVVERVIHMVKKAEFKRRQSPPGARITPRAFGKDWRYPITST